MINDKNRWMFEAALDFLASAVLGWLILGTIAASFVESTMIKADTDPGDLVKFAPLAAQIAVTWGIWKLFRAHDWLKGTPPNPPA